jgi:hypothetical protein
MKTHIKPIIVLVSGGVLLSAMTCQTARAQTTIESGTAYLIDVEGDSPSSPAGMNEDLSVVYSVTELGSVYTYNYTIQNPSGDVLLNGINAGQPETINNFTISFDAQSGTTVLSTAPNGYSPLVLPGAGVTWSFSSISPGGSTEEMSFTSPLGPGSGYGDVQDANEPSPWGGVGVGQPLPVPDAVPEPATTTLLALTTVSLLLFRSMLRRKAGSSQ